MTLNRRKGGCTRTGTRTRTGRAGWSLGLYAFWFEDVEGLGVGYDVEKCPKLGGRCLISDVDWDVIDVECHHNYSNVVSWKDCLRNVGWTINNVARKSKCQQAKKGLETSMCRRSFGRIVRRKKPMWPWPWSAAEHVRGGTMRKNKGMLKGGIRINRQSWVEKSVLSELSRRVWSAWK